MVSEYIALAVAGVLLATVLVALFSRKVSISLIALFYASIMLGVVFTIYGDVLVGLLTMVTFAGAVSVLLLSVILITGESKLDIGAGKVSVGLTALTLAVAVTCVYVLTSGLAGAPTTLLSDVSATVMGFAWQFRPWDLLILVTVFASSMLAVANLLARNG